MPATDTEAPSLQRSEAERRGRQLRVAHTTLELDLTDPGPTFGSRTTITFGTSEPGSETFLEFAGAELEAVELNGYPLDPARWVAGRIPLPELRPDNSVTVRGRMAYSDDGEGLHRHVDPVDGRSYLYAMSFLNAGPRWFACFDQPDLKSTYELKVQAPQDWTVLGNGPSTQTGPGRWRIVPAAPLSTYFVTLVAGPYASKYDRHSINGLDIPLGLHVRASLAEHLDTEAADLFEVTKASFDYYHRVFGIPYPFGEYHQAFVPDFNAGAMENPGCVTLRDQFIYRSRATAADRAARAGVVAHEMAHMWFGDLVTMSWWDDLWLNESFAEYLAHRCCDEATRYPLWTEFGILRKDWGSVADQGPSTHPVAGNGAVDALAALQDFDGISYAKGAAVLKQLAAYVGDEVFFSGLRDYFGIHRYGNASFADLIAAWTRAGAEELDAWAEVWLHTSGMDTLTVTGSELRRAPHAGPNVHGVRPHTLQVGSFDGTGQELGLSSVTMTEPVAAVEVHPRAALVVPDAEDESWAKIRFGDRTWPQVFAVARGINSPATRVVIANAARDAVRDGDLDPRLALPGLLDLVQSEPSEVVVRTLLRFAVDELCGPFTAPDERAPALAQVRLVAGRLLDDAEAGSDRQLAVFRFVIAAAADVEQLSAWLARRQLPPGMVLDTELGWAIVQRLAVLGADPGTIEDQLRRDPTAAGRTHAAEARAARPEPQAKDDAWRSLMNPSELSAYELYATARGFFQPSQSELCSAYAERYFDEIPATGAFRSGWALGQVALFAYPLPHSEPEILARAKESLTAADLAAPLRRSIVDSTDKLRRATESRARFSGSGIAGS